MAEGIICFFDENEFPQWNYAATWRSVWKKLRSRLKKENKAFNAMAESLRQHPGGNSICDLYVTQSMESGCQPNPQVLLSRLKKRFENSVDYQIEKAEKEYRDAKMEPQDKGSVLNFITRLEKLCERAEILSNSKKSDITKMFQLKEGIKIKGFESLIGILSSQGDMSYTKIKSSISTWYNTVADSKTWRQLDSTA